MHARFESIGSYLPTCSVSTAELISRMQFQPPFDYSAITGIHSRHVHNKDSQQFEGSFALAVQAAQDCLSRSRYAASDLDVLISASITRFRGNYRGFFEPSFAHMIGQALGFENHIQFDVSNACAGMLSGVYVLNQMIRSGQVRNGMVVSGECITPIADAAVKEISNLKDPQFASLSVGDAGAAVILDQSDGPENQIHYIEMTTCAEYADLCLGMPSEHGADMVLYTNNNQMHNRSRLRLWPVFMNQLLEKRGTSLAEEGFDHVLFHQISSRTTETGIAVSEKEFKAPLPPTLNALSTVGNTASTSHFVVLRKHLAEGTLKLPSKVLLVPAASGIVLGSMSVSLSSLEI
jgi:3-oxoacyl-[acyl-carrier-protein] synthase-3